MTVSELTAWLRTIGVREVQKVLDELEEDYFRRHGKAMTNLQRLRLMQLRLAEEVRALDHPELAQTLVTWILKLKFTVELYTGWVRSESQEILFRVLPNILDEVARNVINQQNSLHFAESVLEEDGEEEEDGP